MAEQNNTTKQLVSERGFALVEQRVLEVPLITVENYSKWYSLYVIQPSGVVEQVPTELIVEVLDEVHEIMTIDHTFHPKLLLLVAKKLGGEVPDTTIEMVAGRWVIANELHPGLEYRLPDEDEEGIDVG